MANIHHVADYIIFKLRTGGVFVNVLKLHKLMYYAQAWHLAFGRGQLFAGRFQAWVHGPVSRELYDRFKDYKSMYSTVELSDLLADFNPANPAAHERAHIDAVLEVYGDYTGDQLEEMTHREAPWLEARSGLSPTERSEALLSEETMGRFYAARLQPAPAQ
ncbi:type II toxin-antitoxin system antitoxin SocA domain-containing protein [Shinella yambaruensis]|uniref:Panacea domain-containing protein n=1 Tax=Shinella yambaruensis TaxID=415996 RepID=UPI003D7931E2